MKPTRREFLKSAGTITAAATAAAWFPGILSAAEPNERLGVGLIGTGGRQGAHIQVLNYLKQNYPVDIVAVGMANATRVADALKAEEARVGRRVNVTVYGAGEFRNKAATGHQFLYTVMRSEKIFLVGDEQQLKRLL